METKIVLGIDLGTTYSCVAYVDETGKPVVIRNSESEPTTPSVVWFQDQQTVTVGKAAKNSAKMDPGNVVSFVKRYMGDKDYRFEPVCGRGAMRPEEISSYILRKLVKDASAALGQEIRDVVITCPAYFDTPKREATKMAGKKAGLNVVQILNEPTAAAISYGMASSGDERKNILVYDLGGGTFDVTLISVEKERIEVVCTGGNHRLGGKDWDDAIAEIVVAKYREETGDADEVLSIPEFAQEMMILAEDIKKQLSVRDTATGSFSYDGVKHRVSVTRAEFEAATEALLNSTLEFTDGMLSVTRAKGVARFDELLLVGGSSRMPQVRAALESRYGVAPKLYDPDEAVAKGAAICGSNAVIRSMIEEIVRSKTHDDEFSLDVSGGGRGSEFEFEVEQAKQKLQDEGYSLEALNAAMKEIVNVSSKTFGTLSIPGDDPADAPVRLFNLIYRNQALPAEVPYACGTSVDNQTCVRFQVIESSEDEPRTDAERDALRRRGLEYLPGTRHKELWSDDLALPSGLPRGSELSIMFKMDKEGLLDVTCVHVATGRSVHTEIHTGAVLTQEEEQDMDRRIRQSVVE